MKRKFKKGAYTESKMTTSNTISTETTNRTLKGNSESLSGLRKQYLKSSPQCKVTFRLPKEAAPDANLVTVVGDFNGWNVPGTPMKKLKSGDFKVTLALPRNREYKFRYLIDTNRWENDWSADKYIRNEFGSDDSVVVI